ncbi:MAG: hypothetical protein ABI645_08795 [Pseudomonadota bacterium]
MKSGHHLISACIATLAAIALPAVSAAAEIPVVAQDLLNVRASNKVAAALWTRRPDSYTLQIALPSSGCGGAKATTVAAEKAPEANSVDRSSFFIGNTIANLRGVDPGFGGCILMLIDGRRVVQGSSQPESSRPPEQAAPPKLVVAPPKGPPSIQVWLLRADGTQIPPVMVAMESSNAYGCKANCPVSGKLYRFPLVEGAQAVAAAVQIDDDYYIEKLQPLEPKPAVQ